MPAPSRCGILVCGAGAFGRNHLRIYREMERDGLALHLSAVVESDPQRAAAVAAEFAVPVFTSLETCLAARRRGEIAVQAASVCVPTSAHFAVAHALLETDIDVLIEKPISTTAAEAAQLIETAARRNRILQTGHLERFNPAVTATGPLLNQPMFFEAHRLSVFSPRSLDVDVVLDLMIHDLDIVLSMVRSPVRELHAVGLPILSRKVDIANARVEFESGCAANFTASRVSTERVRKLRFFQPHQYVSIDYARRDLLLIDVSHAAAGDETAIAAAISSSSAAMPGLRIEKPPVAPGEPLRLEIESFIDCVRTRSAPRVSGEDGRAALSLALDINAAIADHAQRAGLDRYRAPSGI